MIKGMEEKSNKGYQKEIKEKEIKKTKTKWGKGENQMHRKRRRGMESREN